MANISFFDYLVDVSQHRWGCGVWTGGVGALESAVFHDFWTQVGVAALCWTLRMVRSNAYDFSREGRIDATLLLA